MIPAMSIYTAHSYLLAGCTQWVVERVFTPLCRTMVEWRDSGLAGAQQGIPV